MTSGPGGFSIEIRPLVHTRRARIRLAASAVAVLGGALFGGARLAQIWEVSLKTGEFMDLALPILVLLSVAVGISTPLALIGLAALAFTEESVEVGPETITIRTSTFERTRTRRIPRASLECWRETYLPLAPWWTWAVLRLAARAGGRLEPLGGAAGPKEKRCIGRLLARATGKPLVADWGRVIREKAEGR